MISLDKIEEEISELESRDTCYAVCDRLATMYTVRDHLRQYASEQPDPLHAEGASEFIKTVNGKNTARVWKVMDDLADTLRQLHPRLYNALIDNLESL